MPSISRSAGSPGQDEVRRDVEVEPRPGRQALGRRQGRLERRDLEVDAGADRQRLREADVGADAVGEAGERLVADDRVALACRRSAGTPAGRPWSAMIALDPLAPVVGSRAVRRPSARSGRRPGRRTRRAPAVVSSGPPRRARRRVDGEHADDVGRRSGSGRTRPRCDPRPPTLLVVRDARDGRGLDPRSLLRARPEVRRAARAGDAAADRRCPATTQPSGVARPSSSNTNSWAATIPLRLATWRQIACAVASGRAVGADRCGSCRRSGHAREPARTDRTTRARSWVTSRFTAT